MCPRHVGGRYPTPGSEERALQTLSCSALHAHHLAQRVYHVHQVALRFHHRVNGLVRHRSFVDDVRVLTALDASGGLGMVVPGETTLRFCTRHGTSGSMTTPHDAFWIALAS